MFSVKRPFGQVY